MSEEIEIFGRNYMFITAAQADELENFRMQSFSGKIDANTCERECYNVIFPDKQFSTPKKQDNIFGVIRQNSSMRHSFDVGVIWIANHNNRTLTYDGVRSMRVANELKYLSDENQPLLTAEEYKFIVNKYSKYFGQYIYRENKDVSEDEFKFAKETIKLYEEQLLKRRRARVPELGDIVVCLGANIYSYFGRYIGKGQAIFLTDDEKEPIGRDLVDMDVDWENINNLPLPTDKDLIDYIKNNKRLFEI